MRQLWLPLHQHIWDMCSPSKPSTWTSIPWYVQSSMVCSCSSDIYILLRLLCLMNYHMPLYIAMQCVASSVLWCNAQKSLIIASGCVPSRRFRGPMNLSLAYDWDLRGAPSTAWPEWRTVKAVALLSLCWARAYRLSSLISQQGMQCWKAIPCGG